MIRVGDLIINHCDGCGSCEIVCYMDAISRNYDGTMSIDKGDCVGCGRCEEVCDDRVAGLKSMLN